MTGGRITGGLIGGTITGGRIIGGFTIGGRTTGGFTIGGRTTGGFTIGGRTTGGLTMGGRVIGPLGCLPLGLCFLGGFPQVPQPRIGVTVEMKSMEMRRRAVNLEEDSIFQKREVE